LVSYEAYLIDLSRVLWFIWQTSALVNLNKTAKIIVWPFKLLCK